MVKSQVRDASNSDKVAIFPKTLSDSIQKLEYPSNNFKFVMGGENVIIFVLYMDLHHKIYFSLREKTQKIEGHFMHVAKKCMDRERWRPNEIDFAKCANRYRRPADDNGKSNADVRMGFRIGRKFLVKAYFTFGLRTVEPGTAHVVQTLNVPMLVFVRPPKKHSVLAKENGIFPYRELHLFDRGVLVPDGVHRIPPGTTYMLFTLQKTFFSLDVVADDFKMPMPYTDPVKQRVRKLVDQLDVPPETPYLSDLEDDDEGEEEDARAECFKFFQTPPFETRSPQEQTMMMMPPPPPPPPQSQPQTDVHVPLTPQDAASTSLAPTPAEEEEMDLQQLLRQAQQPCFFLIQNPPVLERQVVIADVNFVERYRSLVCKEYKSPIEEEVQRDPTEECPEPLDLSFKYDDSYADMEELLQTIEPMEGTDYYESVLDELMQSTPFCSEEEPPAPVVSAVTEEIS